VKDLVKRPSVVSGNQVVAAELGVLLRQLDYSAIRMLQRNRIAGNLHYRNYGNHFVSVQQFLNKTVINC